MHIVEIAEQIEGHLDRNEIEMLHRLAQTSGVIVEIGSYRGRSTVVLALGAKIGGGQVIAIDPHTSTDGSVFNAMDAVKMRENLAANGVVEVVHIINEASHRVALDWDTPVDLVFIDGAHDYESVRQDFDDWTPFLADDGLIALHDSNPDGEWPGPVLVVQEAIDSGEWEVVETANATTVLRRVL